MATFKAKARAVELLGKGQIADLPTAITELWKNGYDAYAKNLNCKLYLDSYKDNQSPIFLLSDDGFGMSESDINDKWFVLGTDSKARGEKINPSFGLERRIPMGEKGIGRLSVSYLGAQMLMLTKKKDEPANVFLMDWRILDNYSFFLEDLNIPLFAFDSLGEFENNLDKSKKSFLTNLEADDWKEQEKLRQDILSDLQQLKIYNFLQTEVIHNFCQEDYHGTTFLIFTPHDQLLDLSSLDRIEFKNDDSINYLRTSLSGLHNDLKNPDKDFETHFLLYDASGKYDLINDFFTQEEMRTADHWLKGEFDEKGFFSGEIKVFNKREKYTFKPNRPPGTTPYGPFKIEWGSLEGNKSSSLLNDEQYKIVNEKLKSFGGLYIYRDDFRVLPYGRTETDFLEFEKRRSLGAGYYFFSHRRFIGYIDLSRNQNPQLKDKAGREGFIQNRAYREFRSDLIDFFIDIAKKYLRAGTSDDDETLRESQITEIEEKYKKQSAAAKRKNAKTKKAFLEQLSLNDEKIEDLTEEITVLEKALVKETQKLEINYNIYNNLLGELNEKKVHLNNIKVQKPQGTNITNRQERQYDDYRRRYQVAENKLRDCNEIVDKTRERINFENLKLELNDKFRTHNRYIDKQFQNFQTTTKESFERVLKSLDIEKNQQIDNFIESTKTFRASDDDNKEDISAKITGLDKVIDEHINLIDNLFKGFIKHISNLQIDVDDDFLRGWYQDQNEKLQKRLSDFEELAQLGMSIEIIDHQFNVMYSQMNDAISEIDKYTRRNPELNYSFRQLKNAFQHLEMNYKLLKPLYRTSRRTREVISGNELHAYIEEFFKSEFNRYRIEFSVDDNFKDYEFFSFDSIIKPVFLNLINNAIYWLIPVEKRRIRIEIIDGNIAIMNSGEKIDNSALEDIFTLFYTRKKDGRGIGLYLAKKNLNSAGYDIYSTNAKDYNKLNGACFVISKINK